MEFAMPIPLRDDFDAAELRREAKKSKDGGQARRLLALATIYDGSTRTEAAKIGGVTLQIVRDWVLKFNAQGPSGLIAGKAPGQTPRLMTEHRVALARMVEDGPIPAVHGVVRWRLVDLCQWVFEEYYVVVSDPDDEPGIAGHGLPQADGAAQTSRPGGDRDRGF